MRTFIFSPRWLEEKKGFFIKYKYHSVFIYKKQNSYYLKIDNDWGREEFPDIETAKQRAFMVVDHRIKKETRNNRVNADW